MFGIEAIKYLPQFVTYVHGSEEKNRGTKEDRK